MRRHSEFISKQLAMADSNWLLAVGYWLLAQTSGHRGIGKPQTEEPLSTVGMETMLANYVLAGFDDAVCDLLREADHIERLILEQATQNHELRAQHVTFGHRGDHFS